MQSEFAKCGIDSSSRIFGDPGVPCNDIYISKQWSCAAISLSHKFKLANPLDTAKQAHFGTTYNHPLGNCEVIRTNSKGVGAGDGQDDGEVTMVICPRKPYCSGDAGKPETRDHGGVRDRRDRDRACERLLSDHRGRGLFSPAAGARCARL